MKKRAQLISAGTTLDGRKVFEVKNTQPAMVEETVVKIIEPNCPEDIWDDEFFRHPAQAGGHGFRTDPNGGIDDIPDGKFYSKTVRGEDCYKRRVRTRTSDSHGRHGRDQRPDWWLQAKIRRVNESDRRAHFGEHRESAREKRLQWLDANARLAGVDLTKEDEWQHAIY